MFKKFLLLAFMFTISIGAEAGALTAKSNASISSEIQGLSASDTKQVIKADSSFKSVELQKLAFNSGVGSQGKDKVVEASYGCSVGCSTGCSTGCSVGCSVGCSMGCR